MDWQFIFTCATIALAVGFIGWRGRRTWRSTRGGACSGGCGCVKSPETPKTTLITPEQLTMRNKQAL